ncbi:NAD-dependent epimerase/dehydratase family protein [Mangrovihabitans endophyticus]|uniref:NDP-sugar dehydratase or epimerase n=1 Tax=Mangrovihabitans endophyticus TaxID=1751298 RepID=A0A8J3BWH9_9ACTN|nr:NAD(P)-dependent oxidoreductase [Mangrovihabitans endophyticus]GGK75418.1 NDP-sugar dehydratase or epimerase [Mangrovihabitans endophyticus]
MKDRVLIFGGRGLIGHALARRLSRRAEPVQTVVADLDQARLPDDPFGTCERIVRLRHAAVAELATVVPTDVRDAQAVRAVVDEVDPTVVVHLAAVSVADDAARHPELTHQTNVGGLRNVLDALGGRDTRLVFVSSSFVYGDFETPSVDERHPLRPRGPYGVTKFHGEQAVREARSLGGLPSVIIRPSAAYGPYDSNRRIVQKLLEEARAGRHSELRGADGVLDFTYVDDLAAGLELAAFHPQAPGRTFNMTAGKGRSLRDLAEILHRHFPGHTVSETPADPNRPRRGTLDVAHARFVLGYEPEWDLAQGVAECVAFYRMLDDADAPVAG